MSRAPLVLVVGSLVAGVAQAQGPTAVRITMPTKDAGIYHLATGTWTRTSGAQANLGPDVIYRSDSPSGYFGVGWEGAQGVDEMILPTPANTEHPGLQESYRIDGFEFAYCSSSAGLVDWEFVFYDSYVPCDVPTDPSNCIHPVATFTLPGMPSGMSCWTVTVDLSGGFEFCMQGDGGPCAPGYQGLGKWLDHAGWGATWHTTDGAFAGPVLAGGNSSWYPEGEGTCYSPGFTNSCGLPFATGLGMHDVFGIGEGSGVPAGCYWVGYCSGGTCAQIPNPCPQFYCLLYTDCAATCNSDCPGEVFCDGNPANVAEVSIDKCVCTKFGIDVMLSNATPGEFTYLLVGQGTGTLTDPPGAVGDLCLGGAPIGRYVQDAGQVDAAGTFTTDILNAVSGGGGGDIPTIGGNLCTPAGQTWRFQYWHRGGGAGPSRFSKGIDVTLI